MTDFSKWKVPELRAELKRRGLAQSGLKIALVDRLVAAENEEGSESEATVQALDTHSAAATSPDTVSPVLPSSVDGLPDAPPPTAPEAVDTPAEIAEPEQTIKDSSIADVQSDLPPSQPTTTIELSQPPETKDSHQSALPSVEPTEANEDRQKRKRRSQSPPPSATDSARKRFRLNDDEVNEIATAHSDGGLVEQHGVDAGEKNSEAQEASGATETSKTAVVDTEMEDGESEVRTDLDGEYQKQKAGTETGGEKPEAELEGASHENSTSRRDSRFKNLFPETSTTTPAAAMGDIRVSEEFEPERNISPAIHPATPALYIRDFMRPLNPAQLQAHLAHLAAPPGHDDDPDVIIKFYIDPIRTHAFISFTQVSAAARVRSALHDRIWPDEKTRKPLWVDFIPAEKAEEWIELEQDNKSGGRGGKKWEVSYNVDEDRHVTATLQEVGSIAGSSQPIRAPSLSMSSPQTAQPIRNMSIPTGPLLIRGQGPIVAAGRERLDVLFKCTTTKPILYFQPVSKERVDRRLDRLDGALSKDAVAGRSIQGDIHRYTFEDGDILVDRGPEIFPGIRPPPGFRGPSGFPARGGGGGFQSRGGYGSQSYRGGGQNFSGRAYDSYRGGTSSGRDGGDRDRDRNDRDRRDGRRSSRDQGSSRRY